MFELRQLQFQLRRQDTGEVKAYKKRNRKPVALAGSFSERTAPAAMSLFPTRHHRSHAPDAEERRNAAERRVYRQYEPEL